MVFASLVELSLSPLIVCPQYRLSFHLAKNEFQNIDDHILAQQVIGKIYPISSALHSSEHKQQP